MKTVVITGTSSGLGLELVKHFTDKNWKVVGLSRSFIPNFPNYHHFVCDISNSEQVSRVMANLDSVDLLINNAGVFEMKDFDKISLDSIDRIIDINLKGSLYVTHYCLTHMKEGSKIIFVNSVAGLRSMKQQAVYCASKAGLKSFADVLGQELKDRKIKVSSIHPGGIDTPLWNKDNPYPCGQKSDALNPKSIVALIDMIALDTSNAEFKTITLFPEVEWH